MKVERINLFVIILLLLAILPWPYVYYEVLRLTVFIYSGLLIYGFQKQEIKDNKLFAILFIVAIVYNPIISVHLTKMVWVIINVATAIFFWMVWKRACVITDSGKLIHGKSKKMLNKR